MKTSEIQQSIFEQTGIKTTVRKLTGSMKIYIRFTPLFQGGEYPKFHFEWSREFIKQFATSNGNPNFVNADGIEILTTSFEQDEPTKFKKERKPKPIEEMKVRQWGSKNSQLRLDKATARNAKKLMAGTTARYC